MANEVLNTIKKRRSIRAYKQDPVAEEALNAVLEAGTFAPTGGGRQSPVIIAITSPEYRKKIQELNAEIMGADNDPYYGAPVVVLVLADGNASTFVEDGSCVLENMMLAATSLGFELSGYTGRKKFLTVIRARHFLRNGDYLNL